MGNLASLTYPGGEKVEYGYYKNGLLRTVTDPEGWVTEYAYDARGNLTNTKRPNGTEELRTYDSAGRLAGLKDVRMKIPEEEEPPSRAEAYEILSEYTYAYDESGNITSIQGNNAADTPEGLSRLSSVKMAYDEENRLISYNGEALRYDADGNMTYGPVNGVMTELTYDCRNRLASAGGMRYTYDAWSRGYFYNIDHYDELLNIEDYGFYSVGKTKFFDEYGKKLLNQPRLLGTFGVTTISGIAKKINQELIITGII